MSEWQYGDAVGGIRDSRGVCNGCGTYNEVHAKNCDYHPDKVLLDTMQSQLKLLAWALLVRELYTDEKIKKLTNASQLAREILK